jgi:hypothetical protein
MRLKTGTVVMANKKYPDEDLVGSIGVVWDIAWNADSDYDDVAYIVRTGGEQPNMVWVCYARELDVLHVPVEVNDIVMFEENPLPFTDLVGTTGQVTWVGRTCCSVKVGKGDFVGSLTKRLTVVG